MCQQTSEPLLEYCDKNVLWKGGTGVECICQTDYCNGASDATCFITSIPINRERYWCNDNIPKNRFIVLFPFLHRVISNDRVYLRHHIHHPTQLEFNSLHSM
ncbi:unnamed protein product [Gongylonema pulchrum]|uniref:Activin_recp domain-containing protein n=1 Tax=Gongylonema pulchrum TaxID=637853 RepID=A0A183D095_9BILA|nr:unnamed protein product [Gongylonema pulchrum]